jgi:rhodanese-related sulfurtransferase
MNIIRRCFVLGAVSVVAFGPNAFESIAAEPDSPKATDLAVQHVDASQAQKLIADKKVVVLDIRTPGEFNKGRIGGAKNIDFLAPDFEQRIDELDKTKTYLVHCASGGRSTRSLALFKKHEFQSVYHLDGGIKAWEKAGLPVEK